MKSLRLTLPFSLNSCPRIAFSLQNQKFKMSPPSFKAQISFPSTSPAAGSDGDPTGSTHRSSGEIHVIVGPMFAGKTTALLRRVKSEGAHGRNVALIKSSKDNRYAIDSVVTHDGTKFPCWALPDLLSFSQRFGEDAYEKLDVIGIDEAQFFDDLYDFCCKAADNDGKIIVVAGLDGDYLRRSFGQVLDIIPLADTITKLTARCELCGKKALFTLRKTDATQTELIGGAEVYMPVCRQHYVNGQAAMEAARGVLESHHKLQADHTLEAAAVI